jgi:hypothetical protein
MTATATDLKVGDIVTVSLVITNTGKLPYHKPDGKIYIFLEDGKTIQSSSMPILEMMTPRYIEHIVPGYDVNPGKSVIVDFVLRAVRPGTVVVSGSTSGEVYFIPDGAATNWGGDAPPLKIRVSSATP